MSSVPWQSFKVRNAVDSDGWKVKYSVRRVMDPGTQGATEVRSPFPACTNIVNDVPDVDESFALIVVDCRDPDLSKDDRPVCGRCAGDEDEVFAETEPR